MTADAKGRSPHEILSLLDLGSPVAEHDSALERYFVETPIFRTLVDDKADVIAGDKGTGKSALFSILQKRYMQHKQFADTELLPAFNPAGTPVFQRLIEAGVLDESQYISVWKAYFVSLAGNWLLEFVDGLEGQKLDKLRNLLERTGLRAADTAPSTLFSQLVNKLKSIQSVQVSQGVTWPADGIPLITHALKMDAGASPPDVEILNADEALHIVNEALEETELSLWLLMDRLDEAFQATPNIEKPALRALFRAYLDLKPFERVRLKLFVRNDLFGRMIEGGFVNLTHVNARKTVITWDDEDLYDLVLRRVEESEMFYEAVKPHIRETVFDIIFPPKVDMADKKPTTWTWILRRIRDGNDVKAPRNLVTLMSQAQSAQLRRSKSDAANWDGTEPLVTGESMKKGLAALSAERVEDTLLAEAGDNAQLIDRFRNGKAEHNPKSLAEVLGEDSVAKTLVLRTLGFLEPIGQNYKIPMLYRDGLGITQGKAFSVPLGRGLADEPDDE